MTGRVHRRGGGGVLDIERGKLPSLNLIAALPPNSLGLHCSRNKVRVPTGGKGNAAGRTPPDGHPESLPASLFGHFTPFLFNGPPKGQKGGSPDGGGRRRGGPMGRASSQG